MYLLNTMGQLIIGLSECQILYSTFFFKGLRWDPPPPYTPSFCVNHEATCWNTCSVCVFIPNWLIWSLNTFFQVKYLMSNDTRKWSRGFWGLGLHKISSHLMFSVACLFFFMFQWFRRKLFCSVCSRNVASNTSPAFVSAWRRENDD